ncbi:hypothetical protein AB0C38_36510 [Amycolatopsis sp. NPDC048633]|uniref:hypothetical protein n=1 Tax=Amycolatopsis sp. NPDC048633 TaxID=3157095 RepID=UPI0033F575D1
MPRSTGHRRRTRRRARVEARRQDPAQRGELEHLEPAGTSIVDVPVTTSSGSSGCQAAAGVRWCRRQGLPGS